MIIHHTIDQLKQQKLPVIDISSKVILATPDNGETFLHIIEEAHLYKEKKRKGHQELSEKRWTNQTLNIGEASLFDFSLVNFDKKDFGRLVISNIGIIFSGEERCILERIYFKDIVSINIYCDAIRIVEANDYISIFSFEEHTFFNDQNAYDAVEEFVVVMNRITMENTQKTIDDDPLNG